MFHDILTMISRPRAMAIVADIERLDPCMRKQQMRYIDEPSRNIRVPGMFVDA